jgi:hypothetical protein
MRNLFRLSIWIEHFPRAIIGSCQRLNFLQGTLMDGDTGKVRPVAEIGL